jgi:type II secretion system protein H
MGSLVTRMTLPTGKDNLVSISAFTLVELLVVLALIAAICAIAAPSLSHFFQGRTEDSEVRRFLSLTHYGQSRAVSEGVPMLLWIDPKAGAYGLEQEPGYTDKDTNAVEYEIGKDLQIDVLQAFNTARPAHTARNQPAIRFLPDGAADNGSVAGVSIQEDHEKPVLITKSTNGMSYEVRN